MAQRYGLIAGNGRFPLLALQTARREGHEVAVVAIENEAPAGLEEFASSLHWVNIGQLAQLIDIFKRENVTEVMMTGQVKHVSLFSDIKPDWRLVKLLASLREKNTAALIGGIQKVLRSEGIELVDSTRLLKPLLAPEGVLTRRKPSKDEESQIAYGRRVANALAGFDVGQSVAICERACVALEAMEGTDAMLRRAAGLVNGRPLTLVKVARGREHMLFDVPVIGASTVPVLVETGTTAVAIEAGKTLMLDKEELLEAADRAGVTIVGLG